MNSYFKTILNVACLNAALVLCCLILYSAPVNAQSGLKMVEVEGVGVDALEAGRQAAANALVEVLGSFVDVNKNLETQTVVKNNVYKESLKFDSKIKEYSQGSIVRFQEIWTKKDGQLIRVRAKVTVRLDDILKLASVSGETTFTLGRDIDISMSTEKAQSQNKQDLLYQNVLEPLRNQTAQTLQILSARPLSQSGSDARKLFDFHNYGRISDPSSVLVLEVVSKLAVNNSAFIKNILEKTASRSWRGNSAAGQISDPLVGIQELGNYLSQMRGRNNLGIVFVEGEVPSAYNDRVGFSYYHFPEILTLLANKSPWLGNLSCGSFRERNQDRLRVTLLGQGGSTIRQDVISVEPNTNVGWSVDRNVMATPHSHESGQLFRAPWANLGYSSRIGFTLYIYEQRKFYLFIVMPPSTNGRAENVKAEFMTGEERQYIPCR